MGVVRIRSRHIFAFLVKDIEVGHFPPSHPCVLLFLKTMLFSFDGCSLVLQILVFSLETGQEVVLRGGSRLSTYVRSGDQGAAGAGAGAPAAVVVAASASSDNKTLAVACAGSGITAVALFFSSFFFVPGISYLYAPMHHITGSAIINAASCLYLARGMAVQAALMLLSFMCVECQFTSNHRNVFVPGCTRTAVGLYACRFR